MNHRIDPECPRCEDVELVWNEGYGYQCTKCRLFVTIPKREAPKQPEDKARAEAEKRFIPRDRVAMTSEITAVQGFIDGAKWAQGLASQLSVCERLVETLCDELAGHEQWEYRGETATCECGELLPNTYGPVQGANLEWHRAERVVMVAFGGFRDALIGALENVPADEPSKSDENDRPGIHLKWSEHVADEALLSLASPVPTIPRGEPLTRFAQVTEAMVRNFKAGWHDADMKGLNGERVKRGLQNVLDAAYGE